MPKVNEELVYHQIIERDVDFPSGTFTTHTPLPAVIVEHLKAEERYLQDAFHFDQSKWDDYMNTEHQHILSWRDSGRASRTPSVDFGKGIRFGGDEKLTPEEFRSALHQMSEEL